MTLNTFVELLKTHKPNMPSTFLCHLGRAWAVCLRGDFQDPLELKGLGRRVRGANGSRFFQGEYPSRPLSPTRRKTYIYLPGRASTNNSDLLKSGPTPRFPAQWPLYAPKDACTSFFVLRGPEREAAQRVTDSSRNPECKDPQ